MTVELGQMYPRSGIMWRGKHAMEQARSSICKPILILLAAVVLAAGIFAGIASHSMSEPNYATVIVSRGDTLWTIAKRAKPGTDPRKTIYQIRQVNELESVNLKPGQTLVIPI